MTLAEELKAIRKCKKCFVAIIGNDDVAYLQINKKQASTLLIEHKDIGIKLMAYGDSIYIDRII